MRAKMRELHYPGFGKCWAVSFSFDREVVAKLKARFPAKKRLYDPRLRAWFVQTEPGNLMNFFAQAGYEIETTGLDHLFPNWPRVGNFTVQGPPPATAEWAGRKAKAVPPPEEPPPRARARVYTFEGEGVSGSGFAGFFEGVHPYAPAREREPAPDPEFYTRKAVTAADYRALHLLESAPFCVVRAAYRALAQQVHPDQGGDAEEAKRINVAFQRIERAEKAGAA